MRRKNVVSACAAVCALVGTAIGGVVTTDGTRSGGEYGAPVAVQQTNVINFEAAPRVTASFQSNQSNVGGKGAWIVTGFVGNADESAPALVNRGVELSIRLSDLPGGGTGVAGEIRLAGFISNGGYDFLSNQVIGGLPGDPHHLAEPRLVNFATTGGNQFVSVLTANRSGTAAVIDGIRDAAYVVLPQDSLATSFGSSNRNPPVRNRANGSEIDGVAAYIYNNNTIGNPNDDILNIHIAGNLETNFNKLSLFIDCTVGGQNVLVRTNNGQDFNALPRMGENIDGTNPVGSAAIGPGLTFDAGVNPDLWIGLGIGGGTEPTTPPTMFVNSVTLPTPGAGLGTFFSGPNALTAGTPVTGDVAGGLAVGAITIDVDNSNSGSVGGVAPNNGGVGGRSPGAGSGSQADVSAPAGVLTGVEFKIGLEGIGYPVGNAGTVGISGIIAGFGWDFMSNQAIGGLTSVGSPDPGNLGFPARDVNFNDWDGNQFRTVNVAANPAVVAGSSIDGSISGAEVALYGSALWVNTTNASAFGDSINNPPTFTAGPNRSNGSEMNALYAYVGRDPANANAPTLFVMVTGNLHDFNKLIMFFDTKAGGQQDIRGDNFGIDGGGFNNGLGGVDGFEFDTGFLPDYAVAYQAGFDSNLEVARHFADGVQLNTDGGGFGGRFGGGNKTAASSATAITGTVVARVGFGDNNLTPLGVGLRSINSNGSELDAAYIDVVPAGGAGTLNLFLAGNLEPNLTSVELFFDTRAGTGQNTLVFSSFGPQEAQYTGNPDVDFGALNRMGGPFQPAGDPAPPVQPGLTFDAAFAPDYYFSFRHGNFDSALQISNIFGNYARLRTVSDPTGPMPTTAGRFLGTAINDSLGGSASFSGGDLGAEPVTAAAINNANVGGVPGGRFFYCTGPGGTNPATVTTGIELAIDLADLGYGPNGVRAPGAPIVNYVAGVSPLNFTVFINGLGHANVSNQFLQHACVNDLGEPRLVNLTTIAGNQYVGFPTAVPAGSACSRPVQLGDANGDGVVNFADITSVLTNFNTSGPAFRPGDANGDGLVNFADITSVLTNFNAVGAPACP